MLTAVETVPVMSLRPQDVESLVDELQAYHAIYSPLFQRAVNGMRGFPRIISPGAGVGQWQGGAEGA